MIRLRAVHRLLIWSFVAMSMFFGALRIDAWRRTRDGSELAMGVASALVALGCLVYLRRARHLGGK